VWPIVILEEIWQNNSNSWIKKSGRLVYVNGEKRLLE